ncbi:hypothetical protein D3H65_13875 [Paraflavitalea soli]|uniref:Uncharacterized protein n=1 Tax=Paraflavitalea soli TaxID=2315862 RepID=A0A3B7MPU0_9BACT|nr:hypothetical protein [Paraflavitalea soli]AXY75006.1 hypothetical protein D3H65_13875 [Paraflavitalea soli]
MKRILGSLLVIALLATSCGKEISTETNGAGTAPGPGPGTGGSGTPVTGTYQPFSKNSYWKYKQTGAFPGEMTVTSTGQTRTVSGISCGVFNNTSTITNPPSTGEGLFGIKDHNYYSVIKAVSPNTGALLDITFLYMNDTASVNYDWDHVAGTGNGFKIITSGLVLEKGIIMTVEGKTYTDVMHTVVQLQYELPGVGLVPLTDYDYYVAKNIGIIKIKTIADDPMGGGDIRTEMNLVEYSIK